MEKTLTYDSDSYGGDPVYCTRLYISVYFTDDKDGHVTFDAKIETEDGVTVDMNELSEKEQLRITRMILNEKEYYEMARG